MHKPSTPLTHFTALLLAAATLLSACGGGGSSPTPPPDPGPSVRPQGSLQAFEGAQACSELESYLETQAVGHMRTQLEAARDGKGFWGGDVVFSVSAVRDGAVTASPAPSQISQTNLRTSGVDEADLVKHDGTRIVAIAGQRLQVLRSWPADQLALQGTLQLTGQPLELFLDGRDRAIVLALQAQTLPSGLMPSIGICPLLGCGPQQQQLRLIEVDLSNPAQPRITRELTLPGRYITARKVERSIRVVLADPLALPPGMRWYPEGDDKLWADKERLRAAWDRLIADNETLIRARSLLDWLPVAQLSSGGQTRNLPQACSEFAKVNAPSKLGLLTVATWNLNEGSLQRSSVLAEPGAVYASTRHLYVATSHWWSWPEIGQTDRSYLHQFDISRPERADYLASGSVEGQVGDSFALDEAASGHLRVVSTLNRRVADAQNPSNTWGRMETAARLSVLQRQGGSLVETGRTADLAPGERVMSARLMGDRGFIVTFRNVDPLFTLDLSRPEAPRVLGELKIPGFSSYLHPLGPNHLIGVGTYVPEPEPGQPVNWAERGLQLSIFDVSDMARPRQTHTLKTGTLQGFSEAQFDHRAFTFLPERGLLALPYASWQPIARDSLGSQLRSEVQLYRLAPASGIQPLGALDLSDLTGASGFALARRSLLADDWLYALSDGGVRAARIDALRNPVATVRYP